MLFLPVVKIFFLRWVYVVCVYGVGSQVFISNMCAGGQKGWKRSSDPQVDVTGGCDAWCEFWDLNSGPLEEQKVLVTAEPSPNPEFP